jgi:hypothetical protein
MTGLKNAQCVERIVIVSKFYLQVNSDRLESLLLGFLTRRVGEKDGVKRRDGEEGLDDLDFFDSGARFEGL